MLNYDHTAYFAIVFLLLGSLYLLIALNIEIIVSNFNILVGCVILKLFLNSQEFSCNKQQVVLLILAMSFFKIFSSLSMDNIPSVLQICFNMALDLILRRSDYFNLFPLRGFS